MDNKSSVHFDQSVTCWIMFSTDDSINNFLNVFLLLITNLCNVGFGLHTPPGRHSLEERAVDFYVTSISVLFRNQDTSGQSCIWTLLQSSDQ